MNNNFDLTIAICVFNGEKYISKTLESLYQQTYRKFNLLIIDDGSTDLSVNATNNFLSEHNWSSSSVILLTENHGTAYARDLALRTVNTPLMMFFDADDIAFPDMIQKIYEKIQTNENLIAVGCYCRYIDINGKPLPGGLFLGPLTHEEFYEKASLGKMIFMPPPTIFRVDFALKAGGYRQDAGFPKGEIRYQDLSEDVDLWGRMSDFYSIGKVMLVLPEVLYSYRKNITSLSGGKKQLFIMAQKLKYIKFNQKCRRAYKEELTFVDYWGQLGRLEKVSLWLSSQSSYFYRQAAFSYVRRQYIYGACCLMISVILNPFYLVDKYKFNFRKKV